MSIFRPDYLIDDIYALPLDEMAEKGITHILFDVDNTIVPYNSQEIPEQTIPWFNKMKEKGFYLCILSNNTDESRGKMFHQKDRVISFPNAKKPMFSKKLITNMLKKFGIEKKNALVVGDQIFTDVLAGRFCNVKTLLVDPLGPSMLPFFEVKRFFEKPIKRNFIKKYGKNV